MQAGEVIVPTYDWARFFEAPFKQAALRGIKSYHHFKFDTVHPGVVEVQEGADEMSKKLNLLTDPMLRPLSHDLPPIITPVGLSDERVAYLHDKIWEFCREEVQDLVCPATMGTVTQPSPPASHPDPTQPIQPPPAKKNRDCLSLLLCSECKKPGHNKKTCPKLSQAAATPLADLEFMCIPTMYISVCMFILSPSFPPPPPPLLPQKTHPWLVRHGSGHLLHSCSFRIV